MNSYKALNNQKFYFGDYSIVPIRFEDRLKIMQWRNEQIFHLRQNKPLTEDDQNQYFEVVVTKLFDQQQPSQLLFSFLKNNECIGYGGLVHINWIDQNAEISFIMETSQQQEYFEEYWRAYLKLIEEVAFMELKLHKIYTYAFDLRPLLYEVLEKNKFVKEAILKEHCLFNEKYIDVIIHSKIKTEITFHHISNEYEEITYNWVSDPIIRKYSFSSNVVSRSEHNFWFQQKLLDKNCYYYIAKINDQNIGSIRFDINNNGAVVSYLLDVRFQGKGLGKMLLSQGINQFYEESEITSIIGYVFKENLPSLKAFRELNFNEFEYDENTIKFIKN